ncbi:hypothetical protein J2S50_002370 [Streptomyces sp. DSM 40167]|nr:hypothetical protein [Streptomyces sp. DSM 40167]
MDRPDTARESRPDTERRDFDERDERDERDDCDDVRELRALEREPALPAEPREPRPPPVTPVGVEPTMPFDATTGARPQVSQYNSPPPMSS